MRESVVLFVPTLQCCSNLRKRALERTQKEGFFLSLLLLLLSDHLRVRTQFREYMILRIKKVSNLDTVLIDSRLS